MFYSLCIYVLDQISVNAASENPTLDTLWASAAEQWKEPTEEDALLLKSLMAENLAGCVKFIEVDTAHKFVDNFKVHHHL